MRIPLVLPRGHSRSPGALLPRAMDLLHNGRRLNGPASTASLEGLTVAATWLSFRLWTGRPDRDPAELKQVQCILHLALSIGEPFDTDLRGIDCAATGSAPYSMRLAKSWMEGGFLVDVGLSTTDIRLLIWSCPWYLLSWM